MYQSLSPDGTQPGRVAWRLSALPASADECAYDTYEQVRIEPVDESHTGNCRTDAQAAAAVINPSLK